MNTLNIALLESSPRQHFQSIEISVENGSGLYALFSGGVDLLALTEWLIENEEAIRKSDFPVDNLTQDSLAKKVHCFYENVNVEEDDLVDAMFDYRTSHCLKFACRGIDFPEIYIGKLGNEYEISLYTQNEHWRYFFNVDDFLCKIIAIGNSYKFRSSVLCDRDK